jgi:hypothetical protein
MAGFAADEVVVVGDVDELVDVALGVAGDEHAKTRATAAEKRVRCVRMSGS